MLALVYLDLRIDLTASRTRRKTCRQTCAAVLVPGIFAVECKSYLFVLHQGESRLTIVAVPGSCASNAVKTAARRDVYTNFYTLCIYRLSICLMKCDIIYLLFCLSDIPKCYEICFAFLDGTV